MSELMNTNGGTPVRTLETVAAEIRAFTGAMLTNIIEIGRRMCEAKEMVPYGEFGDWLRQNTGYSVSKANDYMRLFREYGDKQGSLFGASLESQTFGNLTYTKALALLALPSNEREDFVEKNDVEGMSTRELQQAIKERDEAIKRAEDAEKHLEGIKQDRENLLDERDTLENERDDLERKLRELEEKPKDVAVEKVIDQQAIAAAVAKAQDEAQRQIDAAEKAKVVAEKKLAKAEEKLKAAESQSANAGKDANEEIEKARAEAQTAKEEAETLRKQLAMSDKPVVTFGVLFGQWQTTYDAMLETATQAGEETAQKLRAAIKAQVEAWGKGA